jgi:hypothetical protein
MATHTETPSQLSGDQLVEMLTLTEKADTVELKSSVSESLQRSAIKALDLDPITAQIRQVFFFDTPDLALDAQGLVVRGRRTSGKGDDTVVKLRPVDPAAVPESLRRQPTFGIEVDAMPGGFVCSGSLKGVPSKAAVKDVFHGEAKISKLFSKEQRQLFAEHAPEGLSLDDLSILGPIFVLKVKWPPSGLNRKLVVELWLYPDDSRILELSTKCMPNEAFQVAAEARAYLSERGIELTGEQAPKTRRALDYFSQQLHGAA